MKNEFKILRIEIVPKNEECDKTKLEVIRLEFEKRFNAKVYFEYAGETVDSYIIEKQLKEVKK